MLETRVLASNGAADAESSQPKAATTTTTTTASTTAEAILHTAIAEALRFKHFSCGHLLVDYIVPWIQNKDFLYLHRYDRKINVMIVMTTNISRRIVNKKDTKVCCVCARPYDTMIFTRHTISTWNPWNGRLGTESLQGQLLVATHSLHARCENWTTLNARKIFAYLRVKREKMKESATAETLHIFAGTSIRDIDAKRCMSTGWHNRTTHLANKFCPLMGWHRFQLAATPRIHTERIEIQRKQTNCADWHEWVRATYAPLNI